MDCERIPYVCRRCGATVGEEDVSPIPVLDAYGAVAKRLCPGCYFGDRLLADVAGDAETEGG
jgi:hypothetical protein